MTTYLKKWDIHDGRFIYIWYVLANLPGAINDYTPINFLYQKNFFLALVLVLLFFYYIPKFMLHIGEDSTVKNWMLGFFYRHTTIYTRLGDACFGIMLGHIIVVLVSKIGIENITNLLLKTGINF